MSEERRKRVLVRTVALAIVALLVIAAGYGMYVRTQERENQEKQFQAQLDAGVKALSEGRFADAERLLNEARSIKPNDPVAALRLSAVYQATGRPTDARRILEDVGDSQDVTPDVHYELALLRKEQGDLAGAEEAAEDAVSMRPNYIGARFLLAGIYADQDRIDEAIREYKALEATSANLPDNLFLIYKNLGTLYSKKGQAHQAQFYLTKALRLRPDDVDVKKELASVAQ